MTVSRRTFLERVAATTVGIAAAVAVPAQVLGWIACANVYYRFTGFACVQVGLIGGCLPVCSVFAFYDRYDVVNEEYCGTVYFDQGVPCQCA